MYHGFSGVFHHGPTLPGVSGKLGLILIHNKQTKPLVSAAIHPQPLYVDIMVVHPYSKMIPFGLFKKKHWK